MKLLDRYIFSIFGTAFALVTVTFLCLFTAMDLSSRIARILSLKNVNTLGFLGYYYLVRLPMFLHLILPAVTLFAAMFTVIQLQKTNELLPMITSGVSLRRLSLIFIGGAVICGGLMAALDEFVLPELQDDIGETDDILISDKPQRNYSLTFKGLNLYMDEYDRVNKLMKGLTLTRYRAETGRREVVIQAATGTWDAKAKHWILRDGTLTPFDADGNPKGDPRKPYTEQIPPEGMILKPPPTPDSFKKGFSISGRSYRFSELNAKLEEFPHVEMYRMHWHLKFASPLGPLVLLFLGLPFVSGTQHRSFYRGIGLCLLLTIAYYAATFVCFELGIRGEMDPAAAVGGPIAAFGAAGLVAFLRMRS